MDCYIARRQKGYPLFTIVSDAFNREFSYLGNADTGQAWLSDGAATTRWVANSNVAKRTDSTSLNTDVAYIDCGKKDVVVSADVVMSSATGSFLVARMSGTSFADSMSAYIDKTGQVAVRKTIGGAATLLGLTTFAYTIGSTINCMFACFGNDFKIYIDGVLKVSVTDDNALKTNTKCGMHIPFSGPPYSNDWFDNFLVKG